MRGPGLGSGWVGLLPGGMTRRPVCGINRWLVGSVNRVPSGAPGAPEVGDDQAFGTVADKVETAGLFQGAQDQFAVFWSGKLEQGPLQDFLFLARHMDRFQGQGVQPGMVHGCRDGARCRIEILDLLGHDPVVLDIQREFDGMIQGAARVTGNQVGHQELLFAQAGVDRLIPFLEGLVDTRTGFAHGLQNLGIDMFRSDLQLAADMMVAQFFEELAAVVHHAVIETNAGANEDFFDAIQLPQLAQDAQISGMIDFQ